MSRKARRKVGEGGEAENRFQRLPDDVVLHILGKLSDVKWLCRCFVAEKRFASLIPLVQTVSFDAKTWDSISGNQGPSAYVGGSCFQRIFSGFWIENLTPERALLCYPQLQHLRFPHLVFRLPHIQCLNIEHPSDYKANNDSIFKWGANFFRNPRSFTFLAAASLSKSDEEKDSISIPKALSKSDEEKDSISIPKAWSELIRLLPLARACDDQAFSWYIVLAFAVTACLMLRSITITDSKNKGVKLCLSGEKLVEYRKICNIMELRKTLKEIASTGAPRQKTFWKGYVPVVQLPVSGYVMKGVTIIHLNRFALDAFDVTAMLEDFAGEKGVFSEAVVQILEKHRNRIEAF